MRSGSGFIMGTMIAAYLLHRFVSRLPAPVIGRYYIWPVVLISGDPWRDRVDVNVICIDRIELTADGRHLE